MSPDENETAFRRAAGRPGDTEGRPTTPGESEIRAARRTAASHRRRRHPDRRACGSCHWPWRETTTPGGRPARGCPPRLHALDVLDAAGQLDETGRPVSDPPDQR